MAESAQKTSGELSDKCIDAALALARTQGWANTSMADIASEAGCQLTDIFQCFETREDILARYGRRVDSVVLERMQGALSAQDGIKDQLFDILMERFDVLNDDRDALLSILNAMGKDPKQILYSAPFLCRSMTWMMELSGQSTTGWVGMAKIAGLSVVYIRVLSVWMHDESPDMAKTMAALDKSLAHADRLASWLHL